MFEYKTVIRLHEADAAGIMFFANYFRLVHDAFEVFMETNGLGPGKILREREYILPLVHASMDYKSSLYPGDRVTVRSLVKNTKNSSFILSHEILKSIGDDKSEIVAIGETVHVSVERLAGKKISLPEEIKVILSRM